MTDLRIVGVSMSQLELEGSDGAKHTLEISEDLLKALKSRKPSESTSSLTPREIQEQIRHGKTIEQLLVTNPSDEDAIRKFGAPIVSELSHVVSLARNVRLNLATDRFADPANIEFGLVMDDRLATNKATDLSWTARKSTDGQWLVTVRFTLGPDAAHATWSFNAKQLLLTPENQTAIQLSNGMPLNQGNRQAESSHPTNQPSSNFIHPVTEPEPVLEAAAPLSLVPEIVVEAVTEVIPIQEETSSRPLLRIIDEEPENIFTSNYLDEPLEDNIEEHLPEPILQVEESPEEAIVEDEPIIEDIFLNDAVEEDSTIQEPAQPKPQSTSRWAEVLFGEKADEEEF
jgi:hypothetical protein